MSEKKRSVWPYIGLLGIIVVIFFGQVALYNLYSNITSSKEFDISVLSNFYSIVFTIIAIIIGIVAIIGWRWIKDEWAEKEKALNEKINELSKEKKDFEDFRADVKSLKRKSELAEWVQEYLIRMLKKKLYLLLNFPYPEMKKKSMKRSKN